MMRRLLFALLVLSLALAQSPESVGHADIKMKISGYAPQPQSLYVPQNGDRQAVDYGKLPVKYDSYGNALLVVEGNYSFIFDVTVDSSGLVLARDGKFPVTAAEDRTYLGKSNYADPTDPGITQMALDVTRNSRTELGAVRDLALWVNSYVAYTPSYWGEIDTASDVLASRKGVCDEFANLYIAMARSLNIPTRVATGVVYTGSQWQRHAWAESLVGGKWVPVDPTFSEIGMVNAMHVRLYSAPSYLFYQFPKSLENVDVLSYTPGGYAVPLVVSANVTHTRVPPKGTFFLNVNVTNTGPNVLIPTYAAQKTVGIDLLSDFREGAILGPGETKSLQWKFVAPYGERETYYVFLVGPGADEKFPVTVDPMMTAEGYNEFELKNIYASVDGSNIRIETEVKNIGNRDYAGVSTTVNMDSGTQTQTFSLGSGKSKVLGFLFPAEPGTHSYGIAVRAGNASVNSFGTISVPVDKGANGSASSVIGNFLSANAGWLFIASLLIVAIGIIAVLLVPIREDRKIPFEEREEWGKLMKLRKG